MKAPRLVDRGLVVQRAALLVRPGSVRSRPFGATLAPDVWYPVVLADLVLRSVEIGLFVLAWTDESLAEVEREMAAHRRRPRWHLTTSSTDSMPWASVPWSACCDRATLTRQDEARTWTDRCMIIVVSRHHRCLQCTMITLRSPAGVDVIRGPLQVGRHLAKFSLKFRVRPGESRTRL